MYQYLNRRVSMKGLTQYLLCIIVLSFYVVTSNAQSDSTLRRVHLADSIKSFQSGIEENVAGTAVFREISDLQDTVKVFQQRIDSVKQWMSGEVSELQKEYTEGTNKITQVQQRLQSKVDSLGRMALTDNKLVTSLDSVNQKLSGLQQEFQSKLADTKNKAMEKLGSIDVPPEMQQQVNELKSSIANSYHCRDPKSYRSMFLVSTFLTRDYPLPGI